MQESGKPVSQDENFSRPNAVSRYGLEGAMARLKSIVHDAADSIPDCKGGDELRELIIAQATRLVPAKLANHAA
jgi:geranylgeranyl diphosphate synthase type II